MEKVIRIIVRTLLLGSIVFLGYLCVMSILTPIKFEEERNLREKVVIKRLIDIRKVQVEFKNQKGHYTASIDTLVSFIKDCKVAVVMKEGTLTDEQLQDGLTEAKATAIVRKGNAKEIASFGLQNFRRDTTYVSVYENLFKNDYTLENVAEIFDVPYSESDKFEINTTTYTNASGIPMSLFEAKAPYESYLKDLDRQELANLIDAKNKLDKYAGLQVGSIIEPNNNAGNWE
jgi:uncharacterized protein YpmB